MEKQTEKQFKEASKDAKKKSDDRAKELGTTKFTSELDKEDDSLLNLKKKQLYNKLVELNRKK